MTKLATTKLLSALLGLVLLIVAFACDSKSDGNPTDNFDRQAMLRNYADNLIKPAYTDLERQIDTLHTAVLNFSSNPSATALSKLQMAWVNACIHWQYANAYNFGPAGEAGLRKGLVEEIGTFPVNETKIENAVAAGNWNAEDSNRDARGFLAIEYLIFGKNQSADEVVAAFANSAARRAYLTALVENLGNRVGEVVTAWNGAYHNEFIQNDGTDVGSSTSQLYNEFVRSYESIKNFKLGLPLGKRPGQVQAEPQLVEAFYSGESRKMLLYHFAAIQSIWYGISKNGQNGIGFREYLQSVEGGLALVTDTEAQLAAVINTLAGVSESPALSEQIAGDKTAIEALYVEFQKLTRFFKSDMSSLLGIAITFSSSDGD